MGLLTLQRLPYCGAPPTPASLFGRWNLDPALLIALAGLAVLYALGARRAGVAAWRSRTAAVGWAILTMALISPLCALSVSLFSARVGQHMILTLIAAPLIAIGRPGEVLAQVVRPKGAVGHRRGSPLIAAWVFAGLLWLWHAPVPYDLTFASTPVYWAMHVSLIGAAVWLWGEILDADGRHAASAVGAALIGMIAMSLVGALITFSPRALFAPHWATTAPWGLTALEDQQLGGAIMWVPGGAAFLAAGLTAIWRALGERAPGLFGARP